MATRDGVKLIEYNARFGDPEALNLLTLLETDFVTICRAIVEGTLSNIPVTFKAQASVCKYVVPEGYPQATRQGDPVQLLAHLPGNTTAYLGAVIEKDGQAVVSGTRAIGFVSTAGTISEAETACERAAAQVPGRFFHRRDIGTDSAIARRVEHMRQLRFA